MYKKVVILLLFISILIVSYLLFNCKRGSFKEYNTYCLMYGFGYEKQLPEFLTYYLYCAQFDKVIFVEDFSTKEDYKENTILKQICDQFGDRVIYDSFVRDDNLCSAAQAPNAVIKYNKLWPHLRDKCQYYVTSKWSKQLKERHKNELDNTWLLYVNGDEFLNLNGLDINTFLKKYSENHKGLSFMQRVFNDNGVNEHRFNDLLIETHKKGLLINNGPLKEKPKFIVDMIYNNNLKKFNNLFLGKQFISNDGFKSMYRLSNISNGWNHLQLNVKTHCIHHDIANLNHYWIIDKSSDDKHFFNENKFFKERINSRIYLNNNISKHSTVFNGFDNYINVIKNNKSYKNCMKLLSN